MLVILDIWDDTVIQKIDKFKENYQNVTKLILNGLLEFQYDKLLNSTEVILDLINFTKSKNIEFHILTSCHPAYKLLPSHNHLHIHHWPTFWLTLTFSRLIHHSTYDFNKSIGLDFFNVLVNKNNNIKTPYISMNKAPKVHRAILMDMLAKHNLLNPDCVIWRELCNNYDFQYWKQQILLMDQVENFKCQEILPKEYTTAFMQLVSESDNDVFILSEKTAIPLFFNKPFLVAGPVNFHKHLSHLGFRLYQEIFDYSFDSEPDTNKRYDLIAKNIQKFTTKSNKELKKIYNSVFDKCVYNKRVAMKLATTRSLAPNIWQELIDYQDRNNIPYFANDINNFILENENVYRFKKI